MLPNRTFNMVFVGQEHGGGAEAAAAPDKLVHYSGKEVSVVM